MGVSPGERKGVGAYLLLECHYIVSSRLSYYIVLRLRL